MVAKKEMICKICTGQEEKLKLMLTANLIFINGSTNFKMFSLSDHATTDGHTWAIKEQENEKPIVADLPVTPGKVVQETPTYSVIRAGFKRMGESGKTALKIIFGIAHHIDLK